MNKFRRIKLLRYLGLNTENSVLIESRSDLEKHSKFLRPLDAFSVRTFRRSGEAFGEPHYPIVTRPEFESSCLALLDTGYSLIVAEPIDPKDAGLAGCIIRRRSDFVVEVAIGPGTVRRVTHEGKIDKRWYLSGPDDPESEPEISHALHLLLETEVQWANELDLTDMLYEFSVYQNPVGWRSHPVIFWEIHGLERDQRLDLFYEKRVAEWTS